MTTLIEKKMLVTSAEMDRILNNRRSFDGRFKVLFNDLPLYHPLYLPEEGETHRDYIEDDGREYRWLILLDTVTNQEHTINYTFSPEFPNDFNDCNTIEFVSNEEESSLYSRPNTDKEDEVKEHLTALQIEVNSLSEKYKSIKDDCKSFDVKDKLNIPKEKVDEIVKFLATEKFSKHDMLKMLLPTLIEHKLCDRSFLPWINAKVLREKKLNKKETFVSFFCCHQTTRKK